MITPLSHLRKNLIGTSSIIALRQTELDNIEEGRGLTVENSTISAQLNNAVAALVANSQSAITAATARTVQAQRLGRIGLLSIVVLSLICSAAIVWFYVGGVVARLTTLAQGMHAIVKGRRDIEIPTSGRDEITDMARAVEVFRDNAIALDGLLAEREQAAARARTIEAREQQRRSAALCGRYAEAEPLYKRSLAIRDAFLGDRRNAIPDPLLRCGVAFGWIVGDGGDDRLVEACGLARDVLIPLHQLGEPVVARGKPPGKRIERFACDPREGARARSSRCRDGAGGRVSDPTSRFERPKS